MSERYYVHGYKACYLHVRRPCKMPSLLPTWLHNNYKCTNLGAFRSSLVSHLNKPSDISLADTSVLSETCNNRTYS